MTVPDNPGREEYKILVIEDDDADWSLIERALGKARTVHFSADRVAHLNSGLTAIRHRTYDAILLDLILAYDGPTNGLDTVVAVVKEAPDTPIVVLSNMHDIEIAVRAISYGAMSYVEKPPDPYRLESTLRQVIERHIRDDVTRRLMWRSLDDYGVAEDAGKLGIAIGPHLDAVEGSLHQIRAYLGTSAPHAAADVDKIMHWGNTMAALQEIRRILRLRNPNDRDTQPEIDLARVKRRRAISDRALRRVADAGAGSEIQTTEQAAAYLLSLQEIAHE